MYHPNYYQHTNAELMRHTFNRSSTPTSATAAPSKPSGARFTHAPTRSPEYPNTKHLILDSRIEVISTLTTIRTSVNSYFTHCSILVIDQILPEDVKMSETSLQSLTNLNLRGSDEIIETVHLSVVQYVGSNYDLRYLTLRSRVPARCHSSPNSPPPRMFGTARMAP